MQFYQLKIRGVRLLVATCLVSLLTGNSLFTEASLPTYAESGFARNSGSSVSSLPFLNPSSLSTFMTLALKFVEFNRDDGTPIMSKRHVHELVSRINPYFQRCGIHFRLEDYHALDSKSYGLSFKIQSTQEMKIVRKPFDDSRYLVVIHTQGWDHQKMGASNAWTAMPGEQPSGVVLEAPQAYSSGLIAHELGHYLNLKHVSNVRNLMNPVIYRTSSAFTDEQCDQMRKTASEVRASAMRDGTVPSIR